MQHPHDTDRVIAPRLAQWYVRVTTMIWGVFGVGIGLAILIGGDERWSGISYEVAASTPGAPASWGVTILLAGVLILTGAISGRPRFTALGGLIGTSWGVLFAISFIVASIRYPAANNTAFWAYAAIATMFALSGAVSLVMDPPPRLRKLYRRFDRKA